MLQLRTATLNDLPSIIALLADDVLGQSREIISTPLDAAYIKAFENINTDPNQDLVVLVDETDQILGTLQLTYLQYLNHKGSKRAMIESVRISQKQRGNGMGAQMMQLAIARAKEKGATIIQLTSDKQRTAALKFYEKLGFKASHEGFKMKL